MQKLIQFWNIAYPEYFKFFLSEGLLHYDNIKVMELAQTKPILYSLQITHTPKMNLSRVMSYFCSL